MQVKSLFCFILNSVVNVIGMYLSVFDSFMEVFKAHASWIRCLKKKKKYMPVKLKLWEKMQEKKCKSVWVMFYKQCRSSWINLCMLWSEMRFLHLWGGSADEMEFPRLTVTLGSHQAELKLPSPTQSIKISVLIPLSKLPFPWCRYSAKSFEDRLCLICISCYPWD